SVAWARNFVERFEKAALEKVIFVKQDEKDEPKEKLNFDYSHGYKKSLYFLTDSGCGSACLDFADLMIKMPNTIHIGEETSADTVYMEGNVINPLSSNLSHLYYPMKVWRNRVRGNRESYIPKFKWSGSISDTKG